MSAQRNKTDATDALALAHIVRTGWFRQAQIKTESYRLRLLLTQRRNLKRKVLDLENAIRHSLKAFGIRIKGTGRTGFDAAVREAVADDALTSELMDAMLAARAMLWKQYRRLHDLVVKFVARHELCRRFMAIPGVGPVTALSFVTAIDDPSRFRRSRDVAAYFGDLATVAVRHIDRRAGTHQQGRRCRRPAGAVRGGVGADDALQGSRQGADVGPGAGQAQLPPQGDGGRGAQAGRDHARHVDGWNLLRRRCGGQHQRKPRTRRPEGWQAAGSTGMSARPTPSMRRSVILTVAN
jgi:hypothetical protein